MNTKLLMTAASITTGAAAVALSFLSQEISELAGIPAPASGVLAFQVMGALNLGVAITDWMARDALLPGPVLPPHRQTKLIRLRPRWIG